jgi:hypothetical protein
VLRNQDPGFFDPWIRNPDLESEIEKIRIPDLKSGISIPGHISQEFNDIFLGKNSVADLGCLSQIPDPDFYPSPIPDLGSKNSNKREG